MDGHLPKAAPQVGGRAGTRLKFAGAQLEFPTPHRLPLSACRLLPKSRVGLSGNGQPRDSYTQQVGVQNGAGPSAGSLGSYASAVPSKVPSQLEGISELSPSGWALFL